MGLAGRKVKQRIRADPRNLTWSDDSSKFGEKYLKSLGWSSGTGLGASGDGRVSHIKIHQKLDLMGIGANRRGADDAAWEAGRDFEGLLARLNQAQNEDAPDACHPSEDAAQGHHAAVENHRNKQEAGSEVSKKADDHSPEKGADAREGEAEEARKKKKRKKSTIPDETKEAKRRKKEDSGRKHKEERAGKSKRSKESEGGTQAATAAGSPREAKRRKKAESGEKHKKLPEERDRENSKESESGEQATTAVGSATPRYRAHRARHLAAKRLAASSEASMNEILGIAPSAAPGDSFGISSIPFPALDSPLVPRQHPAGGDDDDDGQCAAPGLGSRRSRGRLEQAAQTDDAYAAISAFTTGIGSRVDGSEPNRGRDDQNTMLRTNGNTISEYFAKKIEMKTTVNERTY